MGPEIQNCARELHHRCKGAHARAVSPPCSIIVINVHTQVQPSRYACSLRESKARARPRIMNWNENGRRSKTHAWPGYLREKVSAHEATKIIKSQEVSVYSSGCFMTSWSSPMYLLQRGEDSHRTETKSRNCIICNGVQIVSVVAGTLEFLVSKGKHVLYTRF